MSLSKKNIPHTKSKCEHAAKKLEKIIKMCAF